MISTDNTFNVFCDETGTIFSPSEKNVYGLGQAIVRQDELQQLELELQNAFPTGLHCRELKFVQRKDAVDKLATVLAPFNSVMLISYIESDFGFAEKLFYNSFTSKEDDDYSESKEKLLVERLHSLNNKSPIMHPKDVFTDVMKSSRLLQVYMHALRVGTVDSLRASRDPQNAKIKFFMPVIAGESDHKNIFEKSKSNFGQNLPQFLKKLKDDKVIADLPNEPIDLSLVSNQKSPLLWVADVAAMVGRMLSLEDDRRGMELYNTLAPFYSRSGVVGNVKVQGVYVTKRPSDDQPR